jgi:hypothetical protein
MNTLYHRRGRTSSIVFRCLTSKINNAEYPHYRLTRNFIIIIIKIKLKPSTAEIHIGESTHIQLQLIMPQSFNIIKAIVSNPVKPIPPYVDSFSILFPFLVLGVFLLLFLDGISIPYSN